jgi:hypothetical protein
MHKRLVRAFISQSLMTRVATSDGDGNGEIAFGAFPIQTPVSPNGKYLVTANTLTATITIVDTDDDEIEKMLLCDAGCHGVQFGAKQGGGYYAYVTSKFANTLLVVDIDPSNDGEADDAELVGRLLLNADQSTKTDDEISLQRNGRPRSATCTTSIQWMGAEPP